MGPSRADNADTLISEHIKLSPLKSLQNKTDATVIAPEIRCTETNVHLTGILINSGKIPELMRKARAGGGVIKQIGNRSYQGHNETSPTSFSCLSPKAL
jgi:hypothetical protein